MSKSINSKNAIEVDVTFDDVKQAASRIKPYIRRTPLIQRTKTSTIAQLSGFETLNFKCENLNKCGVFKIRGATNAVLLALQERGLSSGTDGNTNNNNNKKKPKIRFVTSSSGNQAMCLSRAATQNGCVAHIVCPSNAPVVKIDTIRANGGIINFCVPKIEARAVGVQKVMSEFPDAVLVHPYDNPRIIAGQGTCGLEIVEQFAELSRQNNNDNNTNKIFPDVVIVPVGGGGLLSGVALSIKSLCGENTLVIAAEPEQASDAKNSLDTGRVQMHKPGQPNSIADGLLTNLSARTFKFMQKYVDEVITVSELEIQRAMMLVYQRVKLVIEPSAGVSAAVALFRREQLLKRFPGRKLDHAVIVLCGGNVDLKKVTDFANMAKL